MNTVERARPLPATPSRFFPLLRLSRSLQFLFTVLPGARQPRHPGKVSRSSRAFRWLIRIKSGESSPPPGRNKASNPPQFPATAIPDDYAESRMRSRDFRELPSPEIGHFSSFSRQNGWRYCTRWSYSTFNSCAKLNLFSLEIFQCTHFWRETKERKEEPLSSCRVILYYVSQSVFSANKTALPIAFDRTDTFRDKGCLALVNIVAMWDETLCVDSPSDPSCVIFHTMWRESGSRRCKIAVDWKRLRIQRSSHETLELNKLQA